MESLSNFVEVGFQLRVDPTILVAVAPLEVHHPTSLNQHFVKVKLVEFLLVIEQLLHLHLDLQNQWHVKVDAKKLSMRLGYIEVSEVKDDKCARKV